MFYQCKNRVILSACAQVDKKPNELDNSNGSLSVGSFFVPQKLWATHPGNSNQSTSKGIWGFKAGQNLTVYTESKEGWLVFVTQCFLLATNFLIISCWWKENEGPVSLSSAAGVVTGHSLFSWQHSHGRRAGMSALALRGQDKGNREVNFCCRCRCQWLDSEF